MNLHLVFSKPILEPLTKALQAKEYTIAGVDVTLEQFEIAAAAKKIEADIAIVDAAIGVAHKRESIRLLKQIRVHVPELRLILLIPEEDEDWRRTLGMYGIYDVYTADHFAVEDVQAWIETKKTIADVPLFGVERSEGQRDTKVESQSLFTKPKETKGIMQSIQAAVHRFRFTVKKEGITSKAEGSEEVPAMKGEELSASEQVETDIEDAEADSIDITDTSFHEKEMPALAASQLRVIAVGGLLPRSGNTHTAIQIASEMAQKYKTAFIEYRSDERPSDIIAFTSELSGPYFHRQGIDFFPNCKETDIIEVYAMDYEVIVLDLGVLIELTEGKPVYKSVAQEFLRSQVPFLTISAAPWDLQRLVRHFADVQMLMKRASIIINYADDGMFRECKELLAPFASSLMLNVLTASPFTQEGHLAFGLDQEQKVKKRRWFIH
ncbi:hypothetical protein UY286_05155 [Paenibacillus polymyxa]|uniref:hypothetical protein n=1 Tax=Paenibacillus polymyxa TaxID=1406 RepID=UPI002AB42095|nr:hypothetical protein [Paenibacillus polymyxa]MDY7989817.1 hypothetical protein [Paenibacillus polymyxa]MDY8116824.1 hypothetical protein [Paenibacillus polymyxa]